MNSEPCPANSGAANPDEPGDGTSPQDDLRTSAERQRDRDETCLLAVESIMDTHAEWKWEDARKEEISIPRFRVQGVVDQACYAYDLATHVIVDLLTSSLDDEEARERAVRDIGRAAYRISTILYDLAKETSVPVEQRYVQNTNMDPEYGTV